MASKFYFGYGSNLNSKGFSDWCRRHGLDAPDRILRFHSIGYLPDHDICFDSWSESRKSGVLNIQPRIGQVVP